MERRWLEAVLALIGVVCVAVVLWKGVSRSPAQDDNYTTSAPRYGSQKEDKMSSAEHLAEGKRLIVITRLSEAEEHLRAILPNTPEYGEAQQLLKEIEDTHNVLSNTGNTEGVAEAVAAAINVMFAQQEKDVVVVAVDESTLVFDCRKELNARESCYELYKRFPQSATLKDYMYKNGIRRLVFRHNLTLTGSGEWEKALY